MIIIRQLQVTLKSWNILNFRQHLFAWKMFLLAVFWTLFGKYIWQYFQMDHHELLILKTVGIYIFLLLYTRFIIYVCVYLMTGLSR